MIKTHQGEGKREGGREGRKKGNFFRGAALRDHSTAADGHTPVHTLATLRELSFLKEHTGLER